MSKKHTDKGKIDPNICGIKHVVLAKSVILSFRSIRLKKLD